jgi:hypothetical protein
MNSLAPSELDKERFLKYFEFLLNAGFKNPIKLLSRET